MNMQTFSHEITEHPLIRTLIVALVVGLLTTMGNVIWIQGEIAHLRETMNTRFDVVAADIERTEEAVYVIKRDMYAPYAQGGAHTQSGRNPRRDGSPQQR